MPLEQRIFSWNLNDWIARGCALDPRQDRHPLHRRRRSRTARRVAISLSRAAAARERRRPICSIRSACRPNDVVLYRAADAAAALCRDAGRGRHRHRLRRQLDARAGAARRARSRSTEREGRRHAWADAGLRDLGECAGHPRRDFAGPSACSRCRGRAATAMPETDFDTLAATPARRPAAVRAQDQARRHRGLCAFRRHHRLAQAGEAHASRLRLQVLGQRAW